MLWERLCPCPVVITRVGKGFKWTRKPASMRLSPLRYQGDVPACPLDPHTMRYPKYGSRRSRDACVPVSKLIYNVRGKVWFWKSRFRMWSCLVDSTTAQARPCLFPWGCLCYSNCLCRREYFPGSILPSFLLQDLMNISKVPHPIEGEKWKNNIIKVTLKYIFWNAFIVYPRELANGSFRCQCRMISMVSLIKPAFSES